MGKRVYYQDHPSRFFLLITRIIGFLIAGIFILFMVPEFIAILSIQNTHTESYIFVFYALSLTYGLGFLLSFWKIQMSSIIMLICGFGITLYGFLDSMRWEVFLLFIPLSFYGILLLVYWKKINEKSS